MNQMIATIVEAIDDKKGRGIVALDLSRTEGAIYSAYVICSADSSTQASAIADGVEQAMREKLGERLFREEGRQNAYWIALDFVDVAVHIFQTEARDFYKLEQLWADAPATRYGTIE